MRSETEVRLAVEGMMRDIAQGEPHCELCKARQHAAAGVLFWVLEDRVTNEPDNHTFFENWENFCDSAVDRMRCYIDSGEPRLISVYVFQ